MKFLDKIFGKKKEQEAAASAVPVLPREIYEAATLELQDIIAPSALKIEPKQLNLGEKIARVFFIISYPGFLSDNWFSPVINLDRIFDISIFVHPIDTAGIMRHLQKKVAEVESQIREREAKGLVRDPQLDTAYRNLEDLREKLVQAQAKMFDLGLYFVLYADNELELFKAENEIKSLLESKLIYFKPALFQQDKGFMSVIPVGDDRLQVTQKLDSEPLSSVFPFVSFDLTSDKGILYGINRHNSSLVIFDRFSLENYNSIIFAKSGAGKSVHGNSPVLVRKNGVVSLRPIGRFVEESIRERGRVRIDDELEGVVDPGFEVWGFNGELKGSWSKVTVAARKDAPKTHYRFRTQSGREITTTGDHNMLVLREGRVVVAKSTEVATGEYIPLPRQVRYESALSKDLDLLNLLAGTAGIYVSGAKKIIAENYGLLQKAGIDKRLDRYLYKYRQGRRVPIAYFLKAVEAGKLNLNGEAGLEITSASGKASLPAKLPLSGSLAKLLGYIAAEGTVSDRVVIISNTDSEVVADIRRAYGDIGVGCYKAPGTVISADRPFLKLVHIFSGKKHSKDKLVPPILFSAPEKAVSSFLSAYFEGDGGIDGTAITATSKSKRLLSEISYLLLGFGAVARLRRKTVVYKKTGGRRTFWVISISGQENLRTFRNKIGFISSRKRTALGGICQAAGNTNVDTIPTVGPLIEELRTCFGSQLHNIPNISALARGIYNPSREELGRLVREVEGRAERFEKIEPLMRSLGNLPELESLIALGETSKEHNEKLWKELGSSWAWMKSRRGEPGLQNVLALTRVVLGEDGEHALENSFNRLHSTFLDLDALIDQSLAAAFRKDLPPRTSYNALREAAVFVSETYRDMAANLPHVRGILGMLKRLGESDLAWDPIVAVEKINNKSERYVYDLTVDNEIFLAGEGGMFVHNSFTTKLEILRTLMFDTDVIVIDPEREYEYLAEAVGGRYFNLSLSSPHHINPFDLPIPREDETAADVLRSNIINLVGLFRIMLGGLTPEEDALVDRAITETYALKDITADSDFANIEPPLLSDFEMVLSGMDGAQAVLQRLAKFTHGSWAGFINQPSNVDINRKLVVFSVRDMEDELKPVAMYIVTHFIWNAIRREMKKRLLVVDEAWWMMKSEDTASFLFSIAKRGRKYYLGLCTITQDVGDFMRSPYGVPIVTNSSIQLLLKQSPSTIDVLQKTFNLTDEEKYLLLESNVGEGIFFAGLKHVAIKIFASYTEEQIITSDPSQLLAIRKAKEELTQAGKG